MNRRARLGRARVEAVERGGKSVDPVDPSSGGWFREQVAAPEDDEPELGRRLPWLLTAPSRGWCGSGKPRTSAASRGNPASRARSRVYVDMWGGAGPPPERRAVTAGSPRAPLDGGPSWGRQSTCHRHPGEPMDDIASPPTRHKRALPLSGLSQIMLSAGRAEELAPRASESSVPPFGHRRLRLIATPKAVRWVEHGRGAETQRRRRARQLRSGSEARAATNHSPGIKVSPSISSRKLLSGEVGTSDPPR